MCTVSLKCSQVACYGNYTIKRTEIEESSESNRKNMTYGLFAHSLPILAYYFFETTTRLESFLEIRLILRLIRTERLK